MLRSLAAGRRLRAWIVTWHAAAAGVNHTKLDTTGHWTLESCSHRDSHAQATPALRLRFYNMYRLLCPAESKSKAVDSHSSKPTWYSSQKRVGTPSSSDSPLCISITPSLSLRLKTYLFHKFSPLPLVLLLPPGLHPQTIAWTVSSELFGFVFIFSLFFVSAPCARLRWPSIKSVFERMLIYRIVSYRR